jgi:hypothetical protein
MLQHWKEYISVPIYKEGNKTDSSSYRGISLLPTTYKILFIILLSRLTPYVGEIVGDHHCRVQHNRSATDQVFCVHHILEKKWEYIVVVHHLFITFKKVYD